MASQHKPYAVLGVITGVHGIRGEVRLKSFTGEPEAIAGYGPLEASIGKAIEIVSLRQSKGVFIARLKGIDDRTAAEALKGVELRLDRASLPEPEAGEFYHTDLIGLEAVTKDGEPYGQITAVHDFGAGDLLEIKLAAGGKNELIAFTKANVPVVDTANQKVVIVPPETIEDGEGT